MLINGRYRVVEVLGAGSDASVLRVTDRRGGGTGRELALKLLWSDRPAEVLRWEFAQLRRLAHPNLAGVHDLGTVTRVEGADGRGAGVAVGALFLTQDLAPGRRADEVVPSLGGAGAARERWVVAVASAVCRALAYLHDRGVVHRDVKPANVMVGDDPHAARLIDLSLAATGPAAGVAGSPAYMAPEALAGAAEPRSDLFALGVTMYQLLSGQLPFGGGEQAASAVIRAILEGRPRPLEQLAPGLTGGLGALVAALLASSPADRPRSARAVLLELGRLFGAGAVGLDGGATGELGEEGEAAEVERDWAAIARAGALVGRDRELALLMRLLEERLDPAWSGSPVVVVAGPAGVGKSALLREVGQRLQLRAAAAGGGAPAPHVVRGSIRQIAAALWSEAGDEAAAGSRLASWLGVARGEAPPQTAAPALAPDAAALCEELAGLVAAAAACGPLVLHLDDGGEGLGREAAAYLHRRGEVEGLAGEARPPAAVVVELRVEEARDAALPGAARVELGPLGDDEVRAIVADRLGPDVPDAVVAAAVAAARGRPLLLFAFLARAASMGPLRRLDAAALAAAAATPGPDAAAALAGAIEALPRGPRQALLGLALWDRPAGARELAALLDAPADRVAEWLGELWRRGHVELDSRAMARVGSPDLAALAGRIMDRAWLERVHARAAALLAQVAPGDVPARALHAAAAGLDGATELSLGAAEELLAAGDPDGAARHAEAALARGGARTRTAAGAVLRRALWAAGGYERVAELWRAEAERGGRGAHRAKLRLAQALRLCGCVDEARRLAREVGGAGAREALALLARLDLDRGEARAALDVLGAPSPGEVSGEGASAFEEAAGLAWLALGEAERAAAHFEACLALAGGRGSERGEPDRVLLSRAHALLGMVAHQRERWSEAGAHYAEAEALARDAGHAHAAATAGVNVAVARLEAGELGEALSPLRRAVTTLAGVGRTGELAGALYNYAALLLALGDTERALRVHERALGAARDAGARHVEAYCALLQGDLHRWRGAPPDLERARDAYGRAVSRFAELGARREEALATLLEAETAAALGRGGGAAAALERAADLLGREAANPELRLRLAASRARLAIAGAGDAARAALELGEARDAAGARAPLDLRWRCDLLLARLRAAAGDRAGARDALAAAERGVEAGRRHVPEAYQRLWAADPDRAELGRLAATLAAPPAKPALAAPRGADDAVPLRRLLNINKRLNSELRLGRLLDEIIDTIVELTDAERGFLLLRDRDGTLRPRSARNVDRRSVDGGDMRLSRSIAEQVVATGEPVVTVDAQSDGRFDTAQSVHALRLRSILAVPLRVKGEVVGAVYVDDRVRPGAFGEGALQLALDVADQAAIAIENARLLAENRRRQRKIEALARRLQRELDRQRVELEELRRELDGQRREMATKYAYDAIVARSSAMAKVFGILDRVTDSEVPVVIQGESGTGKELVARAIHFNGPRRARPFVTENCGAIPETLLESVLFGHVKGAFTGADRNRQGLFEVASGGTLLLDEISEMSTAMQTKLLRVLQEGELRPVGGSQTVKVDVRVITSSNKDLGELVRRGAFREDLFYRLNVITVRLPSLCERPEDIPLLVEHFVTKHGGGRVVAVDRTALRRLTAYRWPGNVRQLENEIMRAAVLADDVIREEHLSPEILEDEAAERPDDVDLRANVALLEKRLIRKALERFGGNQSRAAAALGLSRFGLQKKITRYKLHPRE